ncbi:MAG: hypothetical protein NTW21_08585 [Verrucomicrobia bacterium]|nr:hypothetical protein [Verrucomicrobiota bacterium]
MAGDVARVRQEVGMAGQRVVRAAQKRHGPGEDGGGGIRDGGWRRGHAHTLPEKKRSRKKPWGG